MYRIKTFLVYNNILVNLQYFYQYTFYHLIIQFFIILLSPYWNLFIRLSCLTKEFEYVGHMP
jgi:hypothetical protein